MIGAVFMDDVAVYGTVFGSEHQLRLVLEGREIFVGVCAIEIEGGVVFEAYGEVDQVFPCFGVVNGLGCPYPFDVGELLGIGFSRSMMPCVQSVRLPDLSKTMPGLYSQPFFRVNMSVAVI